ncbi:MAG TPA: hypothetical protein VGD65_14260 [Chryseosolibacter sp.]
MKRLVHILPLLGAFLFLISCEEETPKKQKQYRPLRIEEVAYKRELVYNPAGQVIRVISESVMPDKEVISTIQEFEYSNEGRMTTSVIDNERRYQYMWEGDRIVKTEELVNGIATNRFTFSYRANGQIKEMLTYVYDGATPRLKGKVAYAFDPSGNLSSVTEFSFHETALYLETINEFDRYDSHPSIDSYFDFHVLNTGMHLHKNNPGRMVSKNKNGVAYAIEDYTYDYNTDGYAVKRETTLTFLHVGSTGSYETHYFFEEF